MNNTQNSVEVDALVERIKAEVNELIAAGTIPATVGSFSELHDFVDANCLGGTEAMYDEKTKALIAARPNPELLCPLSPTEEDEIGTKVGDEMLDLMNPAFDSVDAWIKAGRP